MAYLEQVTFSDKSRALALSFLSDYRALMDKLRLEIYASRETALALTKLQESYMWVESAIAEMQIMDVGK